jgi:hypothetical protein
MLTVGLVLWGDSASAQGGDAVIGTWKVNLAKSTYSPGPPPQSLTVKIERAGDYGEKITADGTRADGQPIQIRYTVQFDGRDYPISGSPIADTVSAKRIDATTTERTDKKAGKVVATLTRKVSADGKTMTVTYKGTNAEGQAFTNVVLLEKQ